MLITGKLENEHLICTNEERLYLYQQSTQISAQTGFQGYLRGDFGNREEVFHHNFFPAPTANNHLTLDADFSKALEETMNALRETILKDYTAMCSFCYGDGFDGKIPDEYDEWFGLRVDKGNYAFFVRLTPLKGNYHVYVFCYRKDWLEQHMEKARKGIRFIDWQYQEKFRLEDGGKIRITTTDGKVKERVCRFIDDYHVEVGSYLYHICEFGENTETAGSTVEPLTGKM